MDPFYRREGSARILVQGEQNGCAAYTILDGSLEAAWSTVLDVP